MDGSAPGDSYVDSSCKGELMREAIEVAPYPLSPSDFMLTHGKPVF